MTPPPTVDDPADSKSKDDLDLAKSDSQADFLKRKAASLEATVVEVREFVIKRLPASHDSPRGQDTLAFVNAMVVMDARELAIRDLDLVEVRELALKHTQAERGLAQLNITIGKGGEP